MNFENSLQPQVTMFDIVEREAFGNRKLDDIPSFIVEKSKRDPNDLSLIQEIDLKDNISFIDEARELVNPNRILINTNELRNSLLVKSVNRS